MHPFRTLSLHEVHANKLRTCGCVKLFYKAAQREQHIAQRFCYLAKLANLWIFSVCSRAVQKSGFYCISDHECSSQYLVWRCIIPIIIWLCNKLVYILAATPFTKGGTVLSHYLMSCHWETTIVLHGYTCLCHYICVNEYHLKEWCARITMDYRFTRSVVYPLWQINGILV